MNKLNISYGQYPLVFINSLIIVYSLGIYAAEISNLPHKYLFLLLIVNSASLLLTFWLTLKKSAWTILAAAVLFASLGISRGYFAFAAPDSNISRWENQSAAVTGTVDEPPAVRQDSAGAYRVSYVVDTQTVQTNKNEISPASGKIYLYKKYADKDELNSLPKAGDVIKASGKLRRIRSYHNPGLIDSELAAKQRGIYASMSAGKSDITIIKADSSFNLKRAAGDIKEKILRSLQRAMPESDASLIFAMMFGGYGNIAPELLEAFTVTGIVHILSVSGSHISLLSGFILNVCKACGLSRPAVMFLITLVIGLYAVLCGCTPPVLRASVMGLLAVAAVNLGKLYEARHILSVTALVMLLIDPLLLFSISFQLSFISTAGLLYIMPYLKEKFSFLPARLNFIRDNISLTLSAQLAVLPLLAWYFNSVSLSSLLANLIAVPPLEFVITAALTGAAIGCVVPFLQFVQHMLFVAASLALGCASDLTLLFAAVPFASAYFPTIPAYAVILYYLCWWILLNRKLYLYLKNAALKMKNYKYALIIIFAAFSFLISDNISAENPLQVHFIDVGQGDAALVITPGGRSVMIDAGGAANSDFDIGTRVDIPYLKHYGVTELDYLILSHADFDHAGGAASVLKKIPVNHLIIANEKIESYSESLKLPPDSPVLQNAVRAEENMQFTLDGVHFKVLRCAGSGAENKNKASNEASNVIKLTYGSFSALFTGDIPADGEKAMLRSLPRAELNCTVLKVAHHGSKTSSSQEFLRAADPRFAVISVGKYNSFGHPAPETMQRLNELPTKVLRTDINGAVVFSTDGKTLRADTFK